MEVVVSKYGDGGEVGALARQSSLKLARAPLTQVVLRPSKHATKSSLEKFKRELRKTSPRSKVNLKTSVGCIECSPEKIFSPKSEMCIRKNGKAAKKQGLYKEKTQSSKDGQLKNPAPQKTKAPAKPKKSTQSLISKLLNLNAEPLTKPPQPPKPPQTLKADVASLPTKPPQTPKPPQSPQTLKADVPSLPAKPPQTPKPPQSPQTLKADVASLPTKPPQSPQTLKADVPSLPTKPPQTAANKTIDCKQYLGDKAYVYLYGFRDKLLISKIKECGGTIITSPMNNRNTIVIYWKEKPKTIFTYKLMVSYADLVKKLNFSGVPVAVPV